jgi:hypothetical protein
MIFAISRDLNCLLASFGLVLNILELISPNPCSADVMAEATFCTHKWCLYLTIQ